MSEANTEGMSDAAHTEPVPTFTRARRQFYAAACGVIVGCYLYAYALWLGALR
jgi:hypothetical protein